MHIPKKKIHSLIHIIILYTLILVPVIFFLNFLTAVNAQSPQMNTEKIGPGVLKTLQSENGARVVIALGQTQLRTSESINLNALKQEVATTQDDVLATLDVNDFQVTHKYQAVPALSGIILTEAGLMKIAQNPDVVRIDLDVGGTGSLANSVPLIGADTWHNAGIIGDGVVVAVLDSGIDTDHSDFPSTIIHQECFMDNDFVINGIGLCPNGSDRQSGAGAAEDDAGHGTHVTGIIASRGHVSSNGVAPGVKIVAIKVTAGPSFSGVFYSFAEVVAGLDFIINNRPDVQVINMSLVTNATFAGNCDNATAWTMAGASAINTLRANGVIAFASSGNTGSGTDMTAPACLSNVVSVGATDINDNVASFTSSNATTDIMAPGVEIVAPNIGNTTIAASGTSMASPHAAGCAALLIAIGEATTPDQIETRLETSSIQVTDTTNSLSFPRIECSINPQFLTEATVNGPSTGDVNVTYAFTTTVNPITAVQPITYSWQVTDQPPFTNTGGLSNTLSLTWNSPGTKTITVTAQNAANIVTKTHVIHIIDYKIYLPVILK